MSTTAPIPGGAAGGGRVLVTGGGGFIGAHLCRALSDGGAPVEAWVRPGSAAGARLRLAQPALEIHEIDLRDARAVADALKARPPQRVFHLAGIRLFGNTAQNLSQMVDSHVLGTLNLLQGLHADARLLVAGSCEEYGPAPVPFDEAGPALAQTAYAVSRLATTLACLSLASPAVCVARLSVVYGPEQEGAMFIPSLLQACAAGRPFAMSSGEQTRDFLYVSDAVRALILLADCDAAMHQVVNVGTGVECTVRQVAEQVARLAGNRAKLDIGAIVSRPGEASRYVCATGKIQALTGWQPRVDLAQGLAYTLAWWTSRQRAP